MGISDWADADVCNALLFLYTQRLLQDRNQNTFILSDLARKLREAGVLSRPQLDAARLRLFPYQKILKSSTIPRVFVPGQSPYRFMLHNRHLLRVYLPSWSPIRKRLGGLTGLVNRHDFYVCDATKRNAYVLFGLGFTADARVQAWMGQEAHFPLLSLPEAKLQPKGYQIEGVSFLASRNGRALLSDDVGLGKTGQSILWALYSGVDKICVCCPASLKENWAREITMWIGEKSICQIYGKTITEDLTRDARRAKWAIINYDLMHEWKDFLFTLGIKALILDEVQAIKNYIPPKRQKKSMGKSRGTAKRADAVVALAKTCPHIIAISGTPFENRPIELFPVLHILDPILFSSRTSYAKQFCDLRLNAFGGYDVTGASNLKELNKLLCDTYMIRRKKLDVLKELPEKRRVVVPLQLDKSQLAKYRQAEENFLQWLMFTEENGKVSKEEALDNFLQWLMFDGVKNGGQSSSAKPEAMLKVNALKQLAAIAKMPLVFDWLDTYLESENKLVVFAVHHEIIDMLQAQYKEQCVVIDGRTPTNKRQELVDAFQKDPKVRLFIGNIRAAGTGLTLTAATDSVTVELGWTSTSHDQAEGRTHRIGQKNAVTAYYLLAEGTIERRIAELIDKKREVMSKVMDGEDVNEMEMLVRQLEEN